MHNRLQVQIVISYPDKKKLKISNQSPWPCDSWDLELQKSAMSQRVKWIRRCICRIRKTRSKRVFQRQNWDYLPHGIRGLSFTVAVCAVSQCMRQATYNVHLYCTCITRNFQCNLNLGKQAQKTFRRYFTLGVWGGHTIDTEKFLHSAENKRVHLENFRRNYKLGVGRHHGIYRNFKSYTENRCHTVVLVNFCTCCTICQALVSLGNITNSGESMSSGGTNMGWQRVCVSVRLCVCVS